MKFKMIFARLFLSLILFFGCGQITLLPSGGIISPIGHDFLSDELQDSEEKVQESEAIQRAKRSRRERVILFYKKYLSRYVRTFAVSAVAAVGTIFAHHVYDKYKKEKQLNNAKKDESYMKIYLAGDESFKGAEPIGSGVKEALDAVKLLDSKGRKDLLAKFGVKEAGQGIILHSVAGGTGKTSIALHCAKKFGFDTAIVKCAEILSHKYLGFSASAMRSVLEGIGEQKAISKANGKQLLVIWDEVDSVLGKPMGKDVSGNNELEQIRTLFKEFMGGTSGDLSKEIIMISTTNNLSRLGDDSTDPIRRRLGRAIEVSLPKEADKKQFLKQKYEKLNDEIPDKSPQFNTWLGKATTLAELDSQAELLIRQGVLDSDGSETNVGDQLRAAFKS